MSQFVRAYVLLRHQRKHFQEKRGGSYSKDRSGITVASVKNSLQICYLFELNKYVSKTCTAEALDIEILTKLLTTKVENTNQSLSKPF